MPRSDAGLPRGPYKRNRPNIPKDFRRNKFAAALVAGKSKSEAAKEAGYSEATANTIITLPEIQKKVEDGLSDAAIAAGVSRSWVISKLKEVAERCLQARPVLDKLGRETGLFVFDASGANRSLELIGKHLRVFGDDASATAQLGANVLRLLAQEAVAGRVLPTSIDADVVPTRTSVLQQDAGPIPEPSEGMPLASTRLDAPPLKDHTHSVPPAVEVDPPHA